MLVFFLGGGVWLVGFLGWVFFSLVGFCEYVLVFTRYSLPRIFDPFFRIK